VDSQRIGTKAMGGFLLFCFCSEYSGGGACNTVRV